MGLSLSKFFDIKEDVEFKFNFDTMYIYKIKNNTLLTKLKYGEIWFKSSLSLNTIASNFTSIQIIQKIKLNDCQKDLLKTLYKLGFTYIARDERASTIYVYDEKPYIVDTYKEYKFDGDKCQCLDGDFDIFKDIVKPKECYEIKELLNE